MRPDHFPEAENRGRDLSDVSWFSHDRFTCHRSDMDHHERIATAAAMPDLDIVFDDASHASHHQQNAFPETVPRPKAGGLETIEELR